MCIKLHYNFYSIDYCFSFFENTESLCYEVCICIFMYRYHSYGWFHCFANFLKSLNISMTAGMEAFFYSIKNAVFEKLPNGNYVFKRIFPILLCIAIPHGIDEPWGFVGEHLHHIFYKP